MSRATDELACIELVELVTDYVEGRLGAAEVKRFDAHVAACDGCRTYLAQMRETIAALGRLPEEAISEAAREGLLEAFAGWRRGG